MACVAKACSDYTISLLIKGVKIKKRSMLHGKDSIRDKEVTLHCDCKLRLFLHGTILDVSVLVCAFIRV